MAFVKNYYANVTNATDIRVLTHDVKGAVRESGIVEGMMMVFIPGATAGVTLLEGDDSIYKDLQNWVETQVPLEKKTKRPQRRSGSGHNAAHLRAALIGSQVAIPITQGRLGLGAWQEVVLFDFDDKVGRREFTIQVLGQKAGK